MKRDFSRWENEALVRMKETFVGLVYNDTLKVNNDWYGVDKKLRKAAIKSAVKVSEQAKKFIDKKYPTHE